MELFTGYSPYPVNSHCYYNQWHESGENIHSHKFMPFHNYYNFLDFPLITDSSIAITSFFDLRKGIYINLRQILFHKKCLR